MQRKLTTLSLANILALKQPLDQIPGSVAISGVICEPGSSTTAQDGGVL